MLQSRRIGNGANPQSRRCFVNRHQSNRIVTRLQRRLTELNKQADQFRGAITRSEEIGAFQLRADLTSIEIDIASITRQIADVQRDTQDRRMFSIQA